MIHDEHHMYSAACPPSTVFWSAIVSQGLWTSVRRTVKWFRISSERELAVAESLCVNLVGQQEIMSCNGFCVWKHNR